MDETTSPRWISHGRMMDINEYTGFEGNEKTIATKTNSSDEKHSIFRGEHSRSATSDPIEQRNKVPQNWDDGIRS